MQQHIQQFLIQDISTNDLSASSSISESDKGNASFLAKESGSISGLRIISETYRLLDPSIEVHLLKQDGDKVVSGDTIATVNGSVKHILMGERVILNLLQRMSGIEIGRAHV